MTWLNTSDQVEAFSLTTVQGKCRVFFAAESLNQWHLCQCRNDSIFSTDSWYFHACAVTVLPFCRLPYACTHI